MASHAPQPRGLIQPTPNSVGTRSASAVNGQRQSRLKFLTGDPRRVHRAMTGANSNPIEKPSEHVPLA